MTQWWPPWLPRGAFAAPVRTHHPRAPEPGPAPGDDTSGDWEGELAPADDENDERAELGAEDGDE
jgi:hypothetical protein